MQWLLSITFIREIHRPSSEKLWHIPQAEVLPMLPGLFERCVPLEAHDTSYFADSASILSFSNILSDII
jgi:hypothetical protein